MTPDLERICQRTEDPPPFPGLMECPACSFSIGTEACASRQVMLTRSPQFRGCDHECSNFNREAHELRPKTLPISTQSPPGEAEEDCSMDAPKSKAKAAPEPAPRESMYENAPPLPAGARVTKLGHVYVQGARKKPCPSCNSRWVALINRCCRACMSPIGNLPKARQVKAARHSPEPRLPVVKTKPSKPMLKPEPISTLSSPPMPLPVDDLVEALAQQLAAKVRARAAAILGMEVTP